MKETLKTIKDLNLIFLKSNAFIFTLVAISTIFFLSPMKWLDKKITSFLDYKSLFILLVLIILFRWVLKSNILKFYKIKEITPFDLFFVGLFWVILSLRVIIRKNQIFLLSGLIFLIVSFRMFQIIKSRLSENNQVDLNERLYELKDLAKGKIVCQNKDPILVNERDANYDLLNRGNIIRLLSNAITHYSSKHSYVIGLVGDWGSGKTTIVNLVKDRFKRERDKYKDLRFMHAPNKKKQDFDLWLYGSQETMIKGLYDTFLSNMGINYDSLINDKFIESVSKVVAGVPKIGGILVSLLSSNSGSYKDVLTLKQQLSKYILSTGNHYVLCIENLDRANNKQVVLLLKLINSIFDLPNVTYVLLYSEKRLNKILGNTSDVAISYADKVINLEIKIPTDFDRSNCKLCLYNLLLSYGVLEKDLSNYDYVLSFIVNNLNDVRELKRIINSTFTIMAIKDTIRLNLPQVLAIQYIYFTNQSLYKEIKNHEFDFIFEDQYGSIKNTSGINKETKDYFKDFKKKFAKYTILVGNLFPKFKLFNNSLSMTNFDINVALREESVCTREYFNDYFNLIESDHVKVNRQINSFIKSLNNGSDANEAWNNYIINAETSIKKSQLILVLGKFTEEISSDDICLRLAEIVFTSATNKSNKKLWEGTDDYDFAVIIGTLIEKISGEEFNHLKDLLLGRYDALNLISYIADYMLRNGQTEEALKNGREINNFYKNMCREIYDQNINLYSTRYYNVQNPNALAKYLTNDKQRSFEKYLMCILSKKDIYKDIYRILYDEITSTVGSFKTGYRFKKVDLDSNVNSKANTYLKENPPKNSSQRIIYHVYKNYLNKNRKFQYYDNQINPDSL